MSKKVEIQYTETFYNIIDNLINHLASYSSELGVINRIERCIEKFEDGTLSEPFSCQISMQLLEVGITTFREYNFDDFRLLYRTIETDEKIIVIGDALILQKQDIQKSLIDYCLIYR